MASQPSPQQHIVALLRRQWLRLCILSRVYADGVEGRRCLAVAKPCLPRGDRQGRHRAASQYDLIMARDLQVPSCSRLHNEHLCWFRGYYFMRAYEPGLDAVDEARPRYQIGSFTKTSAVFATRQKPPPHLLPLSPLSSVIVIHRLSLSLSIGILLGLDGHVPDLLRQRLALLSPPPCALHGQVGRIGGVSIVINFFTCSRSRSIR